MIVLNTEYGEEAASFALLVMPRSAYGQMMAVC
jgi:hypothetical protein